MARMPHSRRRRRPAIFSRQDTGEIFALKTMVKTAMLNKNQAAHVRSERNVLALSADGVDDDWVTVLHYSFQDAHNLYLVMEFLPGGDLMGALMKEDIFTEEATRFYCAEAVLAVHAVHALGYIHRDLKPDNFLLDHHGHLKLTDLGLCTKVDAQIDAGAVPTASTGGGGSGGGTLAAATATAAAAPPSVSGTEAAAASASGGGSGGGASHGHRERHLAYSTVGTPAR